MTRRTGALLLTLTLLISGVMAVLFDAGILRFNNPTEESYPVHGIDVSHHQGLIDWPAVASQGIRFAFIKATEGQNFSDPHFTTNWNGCHEAGMACGAYHFFTFCTPGADQARNFLRTLDPNVPQLLPVVDVEFSGNCREHPTCDTIAEELRSFVETIERAIGKRPMIYVAGSAHRRVVREHFPRDTIWKRNVFFEPGGACREWTFWQFTHRGRLRGIDGFVDLNVFCGSHDQLDRWVLLEWDSSLPFGLP